MLAATGISGSAWAQEITQLDQPTIEIAPGNSSAFNQAACQSTDGGTLVVWNFPSGVNTTGTQLAIWAIEKPSCPKEPPDDAIFLLDKTSVNVASPSGSQRVKAIELVPDCPANVTRNFQICATTWALRPNATTAINEEVIVFTESVTVTYDSLQPTTPVVTGLTPGDGAVTLTWTAQDDIDHWIVYYRTAGPAPEGDGDICNEISSSGSAQTQCWWEDGADACIITSCDNSSDAGCIIPADADLPDEPADAAMAWDASPAFDGTGYQSQTFEVGTTSLTTGKVTGLVNNQRYEFRLVAVDLAKNVSAGSLPGFETPLTVHDFYRRFQCAGGQEKGGFGCSTTGVALLFPVAGLAVLALIRRRRAA